MNRMLKKFAGGVLASLRGSTYGLGKRLFMQAMGGPGENYLRLASSLAPGMETFRHRVCINRNCSRTTRRLCQRQ